MPILAAFQSRKYQKITHAVYTANNLKKTKQNMLCSIAAFIKGFHSLTSPALIRVIVAVASTMFKKNSKNKLIFTVLSDIHPLEGQ